MDVIIFYVIMILGATYLDEGGPYRDSYVCPAICVVNHKHLVFKDTTVVYSNMAKNDNTGFLSGLFNLIGGKQGTEIDALPVGDVSLDNMKEMQRNVDAHQKQILAKSAAVQDMKAQGMRTDFLDSVIPASDKAFETMPADKTRVDPLVEEATFKIDAPPTDEYTQMLDSISKHYGQTGESMEELMDRIAYHESAKTMDPSLKQYGGGPGRGLFQFETGYQQGGMTAMKRLRQYYRDKLGIAPPKWTEFDSKKGLDASKLTKEQQKMLFLGNMMMNPSLSPDIMSGVTPENLAESYWAPYHWAGKDEDKEARLESFRSHMEDYKNR